MPGQVGQGFGVVRTQYFHPYPQLLQVHARLDILTLLTAFFRKERQSPPLQEMKWDTDEIKKFNDFLSSLSLSGESALICVQNGFDNVTLAERQSSPVSPIWDRRLSLPDARLQKNILGCGNGPEVLLTFLYSNWRSL